MKIHKKMVYSELVSEQVMARELESIPSSLAMMSMKRLISQGSWQASSKKAQVMKEKARS